jgi:Leucine-rich repeat (LRR) protein
VNLEYLDCSRNQLTSLDLSKNLKLEVVNIYDNKISRADYAKLDIFSHLVNLQKLDLGYSIDKQERGAQKRLLLLRERGRHPVKNQGKGLSETEVENLSNLFRDAGWWVNETQTNTHGVVAVVLKENDFFGSLEILKNCQNLEELSIEGQKNITGKLEDLPSSVETFDCKGTSFQKELEKFGHNRNLKILRLTQEVKKLETRIAEEGEIHREAAFSLSRTELAIKSQRIEELENQVKQLQRQNEQSHIQELEKGPKTTEQLIEKTEQEIKINRTFSFKP